MRPPRPQPANAEGEWPDIVTEEVTIEPQQPLDAELADFLDKVVNGGAPLVDGNTGLEALKVALAVQEKILK